MDAMPTRHIEPPADIRSALILLSMDPSIVPEKIGALWKVHQEMEAEDARRQYAVAMLGAQTEIQQIVRSLPNTSTNSKYAPLEVIDEHARPIYTRHGFTLEFDAPPEDSTDIRMTCHVTHAPSGHCVVRHLPGDIDMSGPKGTPNKTPIQGIGSSVSYLRRYLTLMVFNIVLRGEDTDGNRPAKNNARLTEGQVLELELLMRQTRTSEGKFLAHMLPGLRSITQAPADDYPRLKTALLMKQRHIAHRAEVAEQNGARGRIATA